MNFINYLVSRAYALEAGVPIPDGNGGNQSNFADFAAYMKSFYAFSLRLGTLLATMMIVYAGYKYIFSRGDDKAATDAKDIFWGAILGVVILYLVSLILDILGAKNLTG